MSAERPTTPPRAGARRQSAGISNIGAAFASMGVTVQMSLIITASLLALGTVVILGYAVSINNLKNRLMGEAKAQADEASRVIERVASDLHAQTLADIVNHPEVRTQLRILTREGGVVMAAISDEDGKLYIQQGSDGVTREFPQNMPQRIQGIIPRDSDLTWELTVSPVPKDARQERIPIRQQGKVIGFMEYAISADQAAVKLSEIGTQINQSLTAMVVVLVALIASAAALLHKVFRHHLLLQQTAQDAEHMAHIGTLASGLAHEIRNPLHAMNLHLEVAKEELEDAAGDRERAAQIVSSVQKHLGGLNSILTTFMNYALPQKLERELVPLHVLVNETVALLRPEVVSKGARVEADIPEGITVSLDPSSFRQVLTNVVLNAAQIMEGREVREIRLTAEVGDDSVSLHIDDTGPGIPPGEEEAIFEAFVSHRKGGSGFGLAIARRVIDEHGGEITAANRPEGGARFTIRLGTQSDSASRTSLLVPSEKPLHEG